MYQLVSSIKILSFDDSLLRHYYYTPTCFNASEHVAHIIEDLFLLKKIFYIILRELTIALVKAYK